MKHLQTSVSVQPCEKTKNTKIKEALKEEEKKYDRFNFNLTNAA